MEKWDGTFELVDPHLINFDRTKYQRAEDWPLISQIASRPHWPSFVVVPCAKRVYAGGTFWAYDGQQRILGMLASQDPPDVVPIVWWPVSSRKEEAAIFIDVNVNRRSVTSLGKFKAQIGAENPAFLTISEVVNECGYSLGINGESAKVIASSGALQTLYNDAGAAGLRVALLSLAEAWPDEKHSTSHGILKLLATVISEMAANGGVDQKKLVTALRRTTPGQLSRKAKDIRYETDCSTSVALRRAFKQTAKL